MSPDEEPKFRVTVEDCERWQSNLQKMAKALQAKDPEKHEETIKMFFTASVLVQRLAMEIQEDTMFGAIGNPFGTTIGDA